MSKNILCPFHNDTRPSMTLYGEWAHCWVCNAHVPTSELNLSFTERQAKTEPTDVPAVLRYIKTLPIKLIRGLQLPYDSKGYYIVWPNSDYYKRRNYNNRVRYTAPAGVTPKLFVYPGSAKHLIVVEGELNAITLNNCVFGDFKVCSPGPASNFMRFIKYYQQYRNITIIVDHDAPGIVFGCQLKDHLLTLNKRVNLITMPKDFNHILQESGEDEVKRQFEEGMK